MKPLLAMITALMIPPGVSAGEISKFKAYVDSDLCARLMLGRITPERVKCSQSTFKDGSEALLVWLPNNVLLTPNKPNLLKPMIGELADVSGEVKVKNGTVKLESINKITPDSIPQGDPIRKQMEVRNSAKDTDAKLHEKIRHELAMMPYISEFDFISFTLNGGDVILTGWTVRETNRSTAYNIIKNIQGVESVVNNIDVLPLGSFDMRIRAAARAALQRQLSRYFWGSGSDIKIIVKNGSIILLGTVINKMDSDIATVQCNAVPNAFHVFNMLRIQPAQTKKSQASVRPTMKAGPGQGGE